VYIIYIWQRPINRWIHVISEKKVRNDIRWNRLGTWLGAVDRVACSWGTKIFKPAQTWDLHARSRHARMGNKPAEQARTSQAGPRQPPTRAQALRDRIDFELFFHVVLPYGATPISSIWKASVSLRKNLSFSLYKLQFWSLMAPDSQMGLADFT